MFSALIPITCLTIWCLTGSIITYNILIARRVSFLLQRMKQEGTIRKKWLPFVCNEAPRYPPVSEIILRAFTIGPICVHGTLLIIVVSGLSAVILPQAPLRRVVLVCCQAANRLCGIKRVVQVGTRASCADAPCIVANHHTMFDGIMLGPMFCRFVAKSMIKGIPSIGRILVALDTIFIDRDTSDSRDTAKKAIHDHLQAGHKGTNQLVVFAEGTTANGEYLLTFRRGVFGANVPVQPLKIEYSDYLLSLNVRSLVEAICIATTLPAREATLHWLPVAKPGSSTPEEFAERVRESMALCPSKYGQPPLLLADASVSHRNSFALVSFAKKEACKYSLLSPWKSNADALKAGNST